MFNTKQKNFGVVKLDGRTVKVYETQTQYANINTDKQVSDARWGGDAVIVYLTDGSVRRYVSQSQYYNV